MEILVHSVHIQIGSTMQKECAIIVIIRKEGLKLLLFANIQIGWPMLEECATVAIKLRNGKNSASLKSKLNQAQKCDKLIKIYLERAKNQIIDCSLKEVNI